MDEDRNSTVAFQGGEPSPKSSQGIPQGSPTLEKGHAEPANEYLTRQEAQSLKEDILRQTQSLTDKAASRIDKAISEKLQSVNETIKLQREAGVEITPQQEIAIRQRVYDDVLSKPDQSVNPQAVAQQKPVNEREIAAQAAAAVIDRMAQKIFDSTGVEVNKDDPEAEMIDQSSPEEFLDSLRKAAEKKAARVNTPSAAKIASMGRPQGQSPNLEAEYREKAAKLQGNVSALIELKKEYRAKGLRA